MTDIPEPERAVVLIPKAARDAFAAAIDVRVVATVKDAGGLNWYYAAGTHDADRLEFALMPGGEEIMLRMSNDRSTTVVCPIEQWHDLVGKMIPPDAPRNT
ncbi:hypothetical protein [Streptomyces sp. NPDC048638]|uniref:hypothetical protein n=1 Tax=Streptomyces sp. NPDC048638 TaxID=3365580 RepID=UPI00371ED6DF